MIKQLLVSSLLFFGQLTTASANDYVRAGDLMYDLNQRDVAIKNSSPRAAVNGAFAVKYIRAIFDEVTSPHFCYRKVSDDELVKVVKYHFFGNEGNMQESAYVMTYRALVSEYPCY